MTRVDRLGECVRRATTTSERLLVPYLTVGDPLTSEVLESAHKLHQAGADALELGLATPSMHPRGAEIRQSFERARGRDRDVFELCGEIRERAPDVPLLPLVFPQTISDLGFDDVVKGATLSGMDGLVLVNPSGPDLLERAAKAGLSPIPVIKPDVADAEVTALEAAAPHLTYRTLGQRTGAAIDLDVAQELLAHLKEKAHKPFLIGFGIRDEVEIRALAPYAAGVIIGSELLRRLRMEPAEKRSEAAYQYLAQWKAAASATFEEAARSSPAKS